MSEQLTQASTGLLTYEQAAAKLSVSVRTLKDWVSRKKIRAIRMGGAVRFRDADLEAFISRNATIRY